MWTTFIPAIIGLTGVLIGAGISTGVNYLLAIRKEAAEDRNWRRDRALEAYSEIMRLVEAIRVAAGLTYAADCGTERHLKYAEMMSEKNAEMYRTTDRIYLLGSDEVVKAFNPLLEHVVGEIARKTILCPKISDVEMKEIIRKGSELFNRFQTTARNDLGIHSPLETVEGLRRYYSSPWRRLRRRLSWLVLWR